MFGSLVVPQSKRLMVSQILENSSSVSVTCTEIRDIRVTLELVIQIFQDLSV